MVDVSGMSLEELKELRDKCNVRIASLTLQEKKKENPAKYGCRTMELYFRQDVREIMDQIRNEYKEFIKKDYDGWCYEKGPYGSYMIVHLFAPKEVRDEIREKYKYHRIYQEYTPTSKVMYKGYVIDDVKGVSNERSK